MKTKIISLSAALASALILVACSTMPGKVSSKDLGIPDVAACRANLANVDCEAGIGG